MTCFFSRHIFLTIFFSLLTLWIVGFALFVATILFNNPVYHKTDGIVVLTGGMGRINTAMQLMELNCDQQLLISGVGNKITFQDIQKTFATPATPTCTHHITLGHNATSTMGNAIETAAWAHYHHLQSLTVITSNYHIDRAILELQNLLDPIPLYPYAIRSITFRNLFRLSTGRLLFIEYNKLIMAYTGLIHTTHSKKDLINISSH